jgi:hypothetical protein
VQGEPFLHGFEGSLNVQSSRLDDLLLTEKQDLTFHDIPS